MQPSDTRFKLERVENMFSLTSCPVYKVTLTGGRIGYIRDYTVSPKNPSFAFQFNVSAGPGTDWRGGFKELDSALTALEAVARQTYDALAQCEFKY